MTRLDMPHRGRSRIATIPNARDEPAPEEMLHILRPRLDQNAGRHDDSKYDQHALPAQPLTHEQRQHGASETAQVVHRRDETHETRGWIVEIADEFIADDDAAEDALLVAEEAHHRAGGDGDGRVGARGVPCRGEEESPTSDGDAGTGGWAAGVVELFGARGFGGWLQVVESGSAGDLGGVGEALVGHFGADGI